MSEKDWPTEEELDRLIASHYGPQGDGLPVALHGRIVATIQARTGRRGFGTGSRRMVHLAPAAFALLAVAAIAVATIPSLTTARPTASPSEAPTQRSAPPESPSAVPTPSPAPTFVNDPSHFDGDLRLEACGGLKAGIETIVPLDHAWAYRAVLPGFGFAPELDGSPAPALLVVLSGNWPGSSAMSGPIRHGPAPSVSLTLPPATPRPAGVRNVCIAVSGMVNPPRVSDVKLTPFHPDLATLAVPPAAQAGRAQIVFHARSMIDNLAWDSRSHVLWFADTTDGVFYRLDPATGAIRNWSLATGGRDASGAQVVIDDTGAVWCVLAGEYLERLDPVSGSVTRYVADLSLKPIVKSDMEPPEYQVTSITAIASDGDGVLVARRFLPYLTRVDSGMREVGRIPIPAVRSGSQALATIGGDRILIGESEDGPALDNAIITRQGAVVHTLPFVSQSSGFYYDTVTPDGQGRVATDGRDELDLVDASGEIVSRAPASSAALDLPLGGFQDQDSMMGSWPALAQAVITDWNGTMWYVLGGYLVEVKAP